MTEEEGNPSLSSEARQILQGQKPARDVSREVLIGHPFVKEGHKCYKPVLRTMLTIFF